MRDLSGRKIIIDILENSVFEREPPVLLEIGSSGVFNSVFEIYKKYSVIICIDADDRDFNILGTKSVIKVNKVISDQINGSVDFYLTKSPYCSSTLEPNLEELQEYIFCELFTVEKKIKIEATTLNELLNSNNLHRVDWFKTDSQGTDLRLYKSLPMEIQKSVLIAEFEPGILNAYKGEDKLFSVLEYMDSLGFWVCQADIKGSKRFNKNLLCKYLSENKIHKYSEEIAISPGWAEISFMNSFNCAENKSKRDILLGIAMAISINQLGFALQLTFRGSGIYSDNDFTKIAESLQFLIESRIRKRKWNYWLYLPIKFYCRIIGV